MAKQSCPKLKEEDQVFILSLEQALGVGYPQRWDVTLVKVTLFS